MVISGWSSTNVGSSAPLGWRRPCTPIGHGACRRGPSDVCNTPTECPSRLSTAVAHHRGSGGTENNISCAGVPPWPLLEPLGRQRPRKRGQTCFALPPSKYLRANLVCALRMAATTRARCAAARQRPSVHLADSCPVKQSGTCYTRTEKKIGPRQRSCGGQETHVVIHVGTCRYICRRARYCEWSICEPGQGFGAGPQWERSGP